MRNMLKNPVSGISGRSIPPTQGLLMGSVPLKWKYCNIQFYGVFRPYLKKSLIQETESAIVQRHWNKTSQQSVLLLILGLLICTLISENQGLEKLRSVSNLRKISGPEHLIFFSVHLSFFSVCYLDFFQVYGINLKKIHLTN